MPFELVIAEERLVPSLVLRSAEALLRLPEMHLVARQRESARARALSRRKQRVVFCGVSHGACPASESDLASVASNQPLARGYSCSARVSDALSGS